MKQCAFMMYHALLSKTTSKERHIGSCNVQICKAYEVWVPYSALLCILVPEHDEHLLIIVVFLAQWWNF